MGIYWPIFLFSLLSVSQAWDSDDLEVFDVVEEVGENFYSLLQVSENASVSEIKRAFRKLSLIHHPDKSTADDAEIKFRQLAAVYEILRSDKKRSIYQDVLENGLPNWKSAVYYYRRVRKMGLVEMSVILFIIITIGQYLVAWASYFEKRYAIQEYINTKKKSLERKQKRGKIDQNTVEKLPDMLVLSIPKPTMACTLPVQISKLIWFLVVQLPPISFYWLKNYIKSRNYKKTEPECESESEEEVIVREKAPRRRKGGFQAPELSADQVPSSRPKPASTQQKSPAPVIKGGLWTDDDFEDLIRLMKKFPAGTQDRWEKIGEAMRRAGSEVAYMAHKIKDQAFNPFKQNEDTEETVEPVKKVKTRKETPKEEDGWSQVQQKSLEAALAKFPKGSAGDRWDRIASLVPGKNKEECMLRYKYIVDMLKKKKEVPNDEEKDEEIPDSAES